MDVVIKKLEVKEWQEYRDIYLDWLKKEPQTTGVCYEDEVVLSASGWESHLTKYLSDPTNIIFVAKKDNHFIGTVCSVREKGKKMEHIAIITRTYVRSEYRAKGVGKKLFQMLLDELEGDDRIVKLNLDVTTTQIPAIKMYETFGFQKVGELKKEYFVDGEYYDVFEMEKYLS